MSLPAGARLGPYEIQTLLGAGGMGEVYRARDGQLGRDVAIKVIRPDVASDPDRLTRFEQEARAASALNHPNIVTIYDVARQGTAPYIAMEWIAGKSVREVLGRGRMPIRTLLQTATQLADGLAKAHAAGIVHRDLKPENVMVTDDRLVKILDFGLAKLAPSPDPALTDAFTVKATTEAGIVMGTAGYMSPEQAAGRPVDHRSDQFALGLMLYEMATGERPFQKQTAVETMAAIIQNEPAPVAQLNPQVPAHLSVIIARCLAKSPADRYESTRDLARDLRDVFESTATPALTRESPASSRRPRAAIVGALSIAILATVAGTVWIMRPRPAAEHAGSDEARRVVAVRPFKNLSSDASDAYLAAGMTEEIRGQLSKLGALRLLSRTAVERLGDADSKRLGDILGAGSVVEGSVRLDKGRVRVSVELVDPRTAQARWSEQYERNLEDVFAVQSDVALQIARALNATLNAGERELVAKRPTQNVEAYQLFLRAQELSSDDRQQNARAIALLKTALDLDPKFAVAQARMAYRTLFATYFEGPQHIETARQLALKAIELEPMLPQAHTTLASVYGHKGWARESRREFQRALEIDPNLRGAMSNLSVLEGEILGRWDEGLRWGRRAFQQSAYEGNDFYHLVYPLLFLRDDATSRRWIEEGARRALNFPRLHFVLAALEYFEGKEAAAMTRLRQLADSHPGNEEVQIALAEIAFLTGQPDAELRVEPYAHRASELSAGWLVKPESFRTLYAFLLAQRGETAKANALFDEALSAAHKLLEERNESQRVPIEIAAIHAARGEKDKALEWLSRGVEAGYKDYETLGRDPLFAELRSAPRFQAIRQQMQHAVTVMREGSADLRALRTEPVPSTRSAR